VWVWAFRRSLKRSVCGSDAWLGQVYHGRGGAAHKGGWVRGWKFDVRISTGAVNLTYVGGSRGGYSFACLGEVFGCRERPARASIESIDDTTALCEDAKRLIKTTRTLDDPK
jgi:hypothetical protein